MCYKNFGETMIDPGMLMIGASYTLMRDLDMRVVGSNGWVKIEKGRILVYSADYKDHLRIAVILEPEKDEAQRTLFVDKSEFAAATEVKIIPKGQEKKRMQVIRPIKGCISGSDKECDVEAGTILVLEGSITKNGVLARIEGEKRSLIFNYFEFNDKTVPAAT